MTSSAPTTKFNASTQAIAGEARRPGSAGGSAQAFAVADLSNSALRQIQQPAGMMPRGTVDAPFRQLGSPQTLPSGKRARLMTGAGSSKQESVARYNTGMGGMSNGAFRAIERFMPGSVPTNQFQMAGNKDMRFGQHAQSEWGVPSFAGFGAAGSHPGITMFRTGGVGPQSRSADGLQFSGLGGAAGRPTELDSQRSIHGVPNTDPRTAPTVLGGSPNGSPVVNAVTPSTATTAPLTERKPYEEVNAIVQKAHIVRPFAPSFTADDNYAQFMLILRSAASLNVDKAPRQFSGPRAFNSGAQFRHTELTVTAFNYLLASREVDPRTTGKPELKAYDVWRNWEIMGLNKVESAMDVINHENRTTTHAAEKLVNLVQAGPARTYNYWGTKAKQSNVKLYFVLRRVPRGELARLAQGRPFKAEARRILEREYMDPKDRREALASQSNTLYYKIGENKDFLTVFDQDDQARRLHPSPFQLVPYCTDSTAGVPRSQLRYYELDGSTAYGFAIQVGFTYDPIVKGHAEQALAGMVDASRLADAGQLDIQVAIQTHA